MTEKKIESLTQEQLDMIPEHNKEWIAIGRATGRAGGLPGSGGAALAPGPERHGPIWLGDAGGAQ